MYDESLADRVRLALAARYDFTEVKMFGGLTFMIGGNMAVGVWRTELMVRTGKEQQPAALAEPGVREMDMTGRRMGGIVLVGPEVLDDDGLARWVAMGAGFAAGLPKKG